MTALVTGVGLVRLALGAGEPGKEVQQPMAVVILGGIVTSTFLNMIVIPALYLKYGRAESATRPRVTIRAKANSRRPEIEGGCSEQEVSRA
jgi:Cu/Ag efflux pump CusA